MHICFCCSKPIDASICLYQKNYYHASCCRICTPNPITSVKEKAPATIQTPPPPPSNSTKIELADPKKARAGPGRLSFSNVSSFEARKDVNCIDCKKKILGQRYLTYKLSEFRCEKCNSAIEDKCSMCKNTFENEECFKDDENNKLCIKCIKKYQEEKKKREIEKQKNASDVAISASAKLSPTPQFNLPPPAPAKITNIIHCDFCTKSLKSDIVEFDGGQFHPDCMVCYSCKSKLINQKIFKEEKGLACQKCKHTPKCNGCSKEFSGGESYYEGSDKNDYCVSCYNKLNSKACNNCPNAITPSMPYLTFQENNYHFDCFLCGECKTKIGSDNKEFFMDASKKKYCGPCAKKYTSNKGPKSTPFKAVCFIDSNLPICSQCKKQFKDSESFYQKDDEPFCEDCFSKLSNKVCNGCSNPIKLGISYLRFKENDYHLECLLCSECKNKIGNDGKEFYIDSSDNKFCGACVKKNKAKTMKMTAEIYYESDSVPSCNECKKKLSCDESFYKGKDDQPFCKKCFVKLNCKPCGKCPNSIEPGTSYLNFEDTNYHFECFFCGECRTMIGSDKKEFYIDASKKKYCQTCAKKYSGSNKAFKPTAYTATIFISGELPSCFQCKRQFKNNESSYTNEQNDQLYCENCFNSKSCNICSNSIRAGNSFLLFQEKNYHFDCFLCVECKNKIGSDNKEFYIDANNRKYCQSCVRKLANTNTNHKTTKCTAVVFYESNSVPNCNSCQKKFKNNEPFYLGKDDKPYCVECYSKINSKCCNGCKQNITPSEATLSLGDRVFHKTCVKCYKCSKVLSVSDKIFPKEDKFSCEKCI